MKLVQLSVFLENREGRLSKVARLLADADINILALTLADTSDFGILRMVVADVDRAVEILKQNHFACSKTTVIAVQVSNRAGSLASILDVVEQHQLNVEYMYAMSDPTGKFSALIFRFDNPDPAIAAFTKAGFPLLSDL